MARHASTVYEAERTSHNRVKQVELDSASVDERDGWAGPEFEGSPIEDGESTGDVGDIEGKKHKGDGSGGFGIWMRRKKQDENGVVRASQRPEDGPNGESAKRPDRWRTATGDFRPQRSKVI